MQKFPVDVWTVSLATPSPSHLSDEETARASRFKFDDDRIRWTRARSALRVILSRYANEDPARLIFSYNPHGKPSLHPFSDLEFNLSHAGDWAMIAVTRSVPVGVDIERIRPNVDMAPLLRRLGEPVSSGSQSDLYHLWTRREARSKAVGGALFDMPPEDVWAVDLRAPEGYAASLALIGQEPDVRYSGNGQR